MEEATTIAVDMTDINLHEMCSSDTMYVEDLLL